MSMLRCLWGLLSIQKWYPKGPQIEEDPLQTSTESPGFLETYY
jgi:hypothetical protein